MYEERAEEVLMRRKKSKVEAVPDFVTIPAEWVNGLGVTKFQPRLRMSDGSVRVLSKVRMELSHYVSEAWTTSDGEGFLSCEPVLFSSEEEARRTAEAKVTRFKARDWRKV